ncbi:carbohydrate kinase [Rhodobacteraceae bacterium 2CG4]|uniref:Carbohydrate kinase n=1 Tax=Halovulum marinum TaxID=2662447 RepID=A0A6L5YYP6_9RHOB|nr:FGGY-family carbohydrate kinase [Halovulum marinum]MSU89328.1 carbohydrate kinase [Halovulum marinum]
MSHVAVIDIGKTNAKVALVDTGTLAQVAVRTAANRVRPGPPYPHFDLDALWSFVLDALARLHAAHGIDAISVTTHGASAVLLDAEGGIAAPMLDYEHDGPDRLAKGYDAIRPPFARTGSPRLPGGLNLGAQLHWLLQTVPGIDERLHRVVTYPQYWSGRLTGDFRCELTSLGCHTDLWEPGANRYSALVAALGLADRMAPIARADAQLGPLLPQVAARTGLPADTPVACGIHDSNASLYPHLLARTPPFSIVSTGTWVVCMAVGGRRVTLDPARDTLINVAATGEPVPSARFMGGREFERILNRREVVPGARDIDAVIGAEVMLLPGVEHGSGPFPHRAAEWRNAPAGLPEGQRAAAASFYLALMTATCLDLVGGSGEIVVEGPFGRNASYLDMLATATGRNVFSAGESTGTSAGAALLSCGSSTHAAPAPSRPVKPNAAWRRYAAQWRARTA